MDRPRNPLLAPFYRRRGVHPREGRDCLWSWSPGLSGKSLKGFGTLLNSIWHDKNNDNDNDRVRALGESERGKPREMGERCTLPHWGFSKSLYQTVDTVNVKARREPRVTA